MNESGVQGSSGSGSSVTRGEVMGGGDWGMGRPARAEAEIEGMGEET
jgi:hypothetical protein